MNCTEFKKKIGLTNSVTIFAITLVNITTRIAPRGLPMGELEFFQIPFEMEASFFDTDPQLPVEVVDGPRYDFF